MCDLRRVFISPSFEEAYVRSAVLSSAEKGACIGCDARCSRHAKHRRYVLYKEELRLSPTYVHAKMNSKHLLLIRPHHKPHLRRSIWATHFTRWMLTMRCGVYYPILIRYVCMYVWAGSERANRHGILDSEPDASTEYPVCALYQVSNQVCRSDVRSGWLDLMPGGKIISVCGVCEWVLISRPFMVGCEVVMLCFFREVWGILLCRVELGCAVSVLNIIYEVDVDIGNAGNRPEGNFEYIYLISHITIDN